MSENGPIYVVFMLTGLVLIVTMPRVAKWYHSPVQVDRRRREAAYEAERDEERQRMRAIDVERWEQQKAESERRAARAAVFEFYDRHHRYLVAALPEALIDARITRGIQDDTSVVDAWSVAGDLLVQMNVIVLERREDERRQEAASREHQRRLAGIDREMNHHVSRLKALESSPMRAEVTDEIMEIHERLSQLERDRQSIEADSPNDNAR